MMCRWCRHAFTLPEADEAPFTCGRVIHRPFRKLPLEKAALGPPTNLAGQLSKGTKRPDKEYPSLAVPEGEKANMEEYTPRKLAELVTMHNSNLLRKGNALNVGDATTVTGGSTTNTGVSIDDLIDFEVVEAIQANVAGIHDDIQGLGKIWSMQSDKDRLIASTDCPTALAAELLKQLSWCVADNNDTEYAFKAKANTGPKIPAKKDVYEQLRNEGQTIKEQSFWESGTGNPKKRSSLCVPAASILMGVFYGARMARYDLVRPLQALATYLHEWD